MKNARPSDETLSEPGQAPADGDRTGALSDQTGSNRDQTGSDLDQTGSDRDQTGSDLDQTGSDSAQGRADREQQAADRDQAASDRDLAAGGDPDAHQATREVRESTRRARDQSSDKRLTAAQDRDQTASARDLTAAARDRVADARDLVMSKQDDAYLEEARAAGRDADEAVAREVARRRDAAGLRVVAAEARAHAARDRSAAARDRELASAERLRDHAEHVAAREQLAAAETDQLTGARMRAAGLHELRQEVDRGRRAGTPLVVVYVDVVGLKAVNDTLGHAAGDEMLVRVVDVIRSHLRSYDLVVRLGGDEFLCAMSATTLDEARDRFSAIAASLAEAPAAGAIRTGFAAWRSGESVTELIDRADRELVRVPRGEIQAPSPDEVG